MLPKREADLHTSKKEIFHKNVLEKLLMPKCFDPLSSA
jgi:hypothetical protein